MKIAWITDPHFDFLAPGGARNFGNWVRKSSGANAAVITGDIAEYPSLTHTLISFSEGFGSKTFFVLGNHDYYKGSFSEVKQAAHILSQQIPNLTWLDEAGVIELTPEFALVGNGGWYDVRAGDGESSRLEMSDFTEIKDFKGLSRYPIVQKSREAAKEMAAQATPVLREAASKYKNVFFATHVPPFREATWYRGQISNPTWLPWFSNLTFGTMLSDAAYDFPDTLFTCLCGHTHSEGTFTFKENLTVLTGHSDYSNPRVCKVFDLTGKKNWVGAQPETPLAPPAAGVKEIPDRNDW